MVVAFTVETTIGFGAMIVALALGSFVYPMSALLPRMVLLDSILCGTIALRYHAAVDVRWLLRRILPLMTLGLAFGVYIAVQVPEVVLRRLLGALVVLVAGRELLTVVRTATRHTELTEPLRSLALLAAGTMQGIFMTGGPLLVYVLSRSELGKSAFRSTLAVVWVTLNMLLLAAYVTSGRITTVTVGATLPLLPALVIALLIGERLHRRFDERRFRVVVMAALLIIGLTLLR